MQLQDQSIEDQGTPVTQQPRDFSRVRAREHVNPLSRKYQTAIEFPNWEKVYTNPQQPLHLDLGCGRGRFLAKIAQQRPDWNFLGLEIRNPLVEEAIRWRDWLRLTNLHYLFCNVNNALCPLLSTVVPGTLQYVTIQFPDPWFKRRHQKRRMVQPALVSTLAEFLVPGGQVLLQSDVEEIAVEMRDRFLAHPAFQLQCPTWLPTNPLPVTTEREISTLSRGAFVFRAVLVRLP